MNKKIFLILMAPLLMALLYACAHPASMAKTHPQQVTGMPDCGECHTDQWRAFSHKAPDFYAKHGAFAQSQRAACATCHEESFCADCHAHNEEIKPSDKYADAPERNLPHRGDYLTQHMIDGRVDPASCAKCHGRANNGGCKTCHQ